MELPKKEGLIQRKMDNGLKCERADSRRHSVCSVSIRKGWRRALWLIGRQSVAAESAAVVFRRWVVEAAGNQAEASRLDKSREEIVVGFDEMPRAALYSRDGRGSGEKSVRGPHCHVEAARVTGMA